LPVVVIAKFSRMTSMLAQPWTTLEASRPDHDFLITAPWLTSNQKHKYIKEQNKNKQTPVKCPNL